MPEATVHEDDLLPASKNDVRLPRKVWPVQVIPHLQGVEHRAHRDLGLGVLALDGGHAASPLLRCQYVGHPVSRGPSKLFGGRGFCAASSNRAQLAEYKVEIKIGNTNTAAVRVKTKTHLLRIRASDGRKTI
jgi:hypothetical protein